MVTVHHTSPHRDKHIVKIVRELVHRGNGSSDVVRRAPQEHRLYVNSFIVVTVLVMWCGERPKNIHTHTLALLR